MFTNGLIVCKFDELDSTPASSVDLADLQHFSVHLDPEFVEFVVTKRLDLLQSISALSRPQVESLHSFLCANLDVFNFDSSHLC